MSDLFSRPVVCNTGPILGLSRVGHVSILRRLFPEVLVPREVIDELLANPHEDRTDPLRELDGFVVLPACESLGVMGDRAKAGRGRKRTSGSGQLPVGCMHGRMDPERTTQADLD